MTDGQMQLCVPFNVTGAADLTDTDMPSAAQFLRNDTRFVAAADLRPYRQVRLVVNKQATAGATNAKIKLKYATATPYTLGSYSEITSTGECSVAVNVADQVIDTGWLTLATGAQIETAYLALETSGGDGALDPAFGLMLAYFRSATSNVCQVDGGAFFDIDTSNADVGIQAAIDSLGADGGVVEIFPGSADYQFSGAVISTKSNVHIKGHGAVLRFNGAASLYMFRVRGQNWTFDGIQFEDSAASSLGSTQRTIISIEDAGTAGASDTTRIINCRFDVTLATQTIKNYVCIKATGTEHSSAEMRRGLLVQGCTFLAGVNSIPNEVDDGAVPYGIAFIKTDRSGSQRIIGNDFRGGVAYSTLTDGAGGNLDTLRVLGGFSGGVTVIDMDTADGTLTGILQPGSTFTIASDSTNTTYKVTKLATAAANAVSVSFWPALAEAVADNDAVTMTATTAYGHVASAIVIEDHNQTIIAHNIFVLLTCQAAADGEGGALIHSRGVDGESGHSKIECNEFEDIDAWYVVRVEKVSGGAFQNLWTHTQWNEFGRIIPRCEAVISYEDAGVAKIVGNSFHNIGGGLHGTVQTHGYPVSLTNCKTVLIDSNIGSIMATTENLYHDGGGNSNIRYGANNVWEWDYA